MSKNDNIMFPDGWEDVQTFEWMKLLAFHYVMLLEGKHIYLESVLRAWTLFILEHRGFRIRGVDDWLLVDRMSKSLTWVYALNDKGEIELTCDTTVNLLPVYKALVGPASHGADLTFGEFRHAVTAMNAYTEMHDPADLLALCAILYRKQYKDRDGSLRRNKFRVWRMGEYLSDAGQIPPSLRYGIYVQFAYFCKYLQTGTFVIDGSEVSFAPLFEKGAAQTDASVQDLGLSGIRLSVAESGVFGDAEGTDDAPLLQVMLKMLADKQKADILMKNIKNKQQ